MVILNFTPVPRPNYRIGVPEAGVYLEVFNSDSEYYGGSNTGNWQLVAEEKEWMGRPYSIVLTLPPLAGIVLTLKPEVKTSDSESELEDVIPIALSEIVTEAESTNTTEESGVKSDA